MAALVFTVLVFLGGSHKPPTPFPASNTPIEIIVPADPGGGWDMTARAMKNVLDSNHEFKKLMRIRYIPEEEKGWEYLKKQNGQVISLNSSLLLSNQLLGKGTVRFDEFVPLAILTKEWHVIAVPKDSKLKQADDLIEALKKNPGRLKIGFAPSIGNDDQLSFIQAIEMGGISADSLQFLQYKSSNDLYQALSDNEIDVASGAVNEALDHYKTNQIDILVATSDKRIKSLPDVPTWREEGVDFVFAHWRGIMGSPNMTNEEVEQWNRIIYNMVQTDEWEDLVRQNNWEPFYKNSREAKEFLKSQNRYYEQVLEGAHK
jgi:tripartite-type tricarboxylate transporter receptor subunit TctC